MRCGSRNGDATHSRNVTCRIIRAGDFLRYLRAVAGSVKLSHEEVTTMRAVTPPTLCTAPYCPFSIQNVAPVMLGIHILTFN